MKYAVENLDKFIKKLNITSDMALKYCGDYLAAELKKETEKDSYDLGTLANSYVVRQVRSGMVQVGSMLEYAPVREYGRKPGTFPNLDALVGWTARKGMIWKNNASKGYNDLSYKDKGTIYVVARAIAIRGIPGVYTVHKVYEREKKHIVNLYRQKMQQWL